MTKREEIIIEHVKTLLGEPVVSVELTDKNILHAWETAKQKFSSFQGSSMFYAKDAWIREYTLALSMELLANIRGKYSELPGPDGQKATLDSASLISRSKDQIEKLEKQLQDFYAKRHNLSGAGGMSGVSGYSGRPPFSGQLGASGVSGIKGASGVSGISGTWQWSGISGVRSAGSSFFGSDEPQIGDLVHLKGQPYSQRMTVTNRGKEVDTFFCSWWIGSDLKSATFHKRALTKSTDTGE